MAKKKKEGKKAPKKKTTGKKAPAKVEEVKNEVDLNAGGDDGDFFAQMTRMVFVKPPNQLDLTEEQLKEEMQRVLNDTDPNVPLNIHQYSFAAENRKYKEIQMPEDANIAVHFERTQMLLFPDSQTGAKQIAAEAAVNQSKKERLDAQQMMINVGDDASNLPVLGEDEGTKNQFDFSERACQTFNNVLSHVSVSTVPPQTDALTGAVAQWVIYDKYMEEWERVQRDQAVLSKSDSYSSRRAKKKNDEKEKADKDDNIIHCDAMGKALRIIERMVNQNREDEIYQDFKYWEDLSDQYRDGEGSLLPLWRFSSERTKHKHVTCLRWHPYFPDLFAVGFGSYNFMQQGTGLIYCYSLKNTSFPEFTFATEAGVMCLDFHPQHHSLLCVGCYDGSVMVFDVRNKTNRPIYESNVRTGKHTDPVWQVFWQEEDLSKELNFFSVSSDGRVANWYMTNTELKMEVIMELKLMAAADISDQPGGGWEEDGTSLAGLAGGCCFDFNKRSEHLFLVGTEEGRIHKCSKAYSGQYLETYEGHHMIVYAVKWNAFHPKIFMSCSADWTVKIWDHNVKVPLLTFDLGEAVGDVEWSPCSSTVFAAVTSDGKVHVFDLTVNKHEPLCEQKVVKRSKLTKLQFNNHDPILLVGDERGSVISMKLSPNLRKDWFPTSKLTSDQIDKQVKSMEKLLQSVDAKVDSKAA